MFGLFSRARDAKKTTTEEYETAVIAGKDCLFQKNTERSKKKEEIVRKFIHCF